MQRVIIIGILLQSLSHASTTFNNSSPTSTSPSSAPASLTLNLNLTQGQAQNTENSATRHTENYFETDLDEHDILETPHVDTSNSTVFPTFNISEEVPIGGLLGNACCLSHVNITRALQLGVHFQAEICFHHALNASGLSPLPGDNCLSKSFQCAEYPTGNQIKGDLYSISDSPHSHTGRGGEDGDNYFTRREAQGPMIPESVRTRDVQYNPFQSVTIIASCPPSFKPNAGSHVGISDDISKLGQDGFDEAKSAGNPTTASRGLADMNSTNCETCLESDDVIALVTSGATGMTYCNTDCLLCVEGTPASADDWHFWRRIEFCRIQNSSESNSDEFPRQHGEVISRRVNTTDPSLVELCWLEYEPPPAAVARDSPGGGDVFGDWSRCGHEVPGSGTIDHVTFERMKHLCLHSFYWPVYTHDVLYRNFFCYLSQQCINSTTCFHLSLSHETQGLTWIGEVSISLLTDLTGNHHGNQIDDDSYDDLFFDTEQYDRRQRSGFASESNQSQSPAYHWQGCGRELWFNFLEGECIPLQCANGRRLVTSPDGSGSNGKCLFPEDESNTTDHVMYSIQLVWLDTSSESGPTIEDPIELHPLRNFRRGDNISTSDPTAPAFNLSCDRSLHQENDVVFAYGSANDDSMEHTYQTLSKESDDPFEMSDHSLSPRASTFENEDALNETANSNGSTVNGDFSWLNREVLRLVGWKLRELNITSYLIKTLVVKPNVVNANYSHARSVRMSVYFKKSNYVFQKRNELDENIVKTFSGKTKITVDGKKMTFRSVLLQKHENRGDENQAILYFVHRKYSNKTLQPCCHEIDFRTFSRKLSQMACSQGNPNPNRVRIHLASVCPHVVLNGSEFNITNGQILIHRETRLRIMRHQYALSKSGDVIVCASMLDASRASLTGQRESLAWWEGVMSLTLLPASMLCLLATFLTYCRFPTLRSIPGKNNALLAFWLFWAQALVLISNAPLPHSPACVMVGVLLHFSWLATLACTSACSFHMFHVFAVRRGASHLDTSRARYVTAYAMSSHLGPLLIVISVMAVSHGLSDDGGQTITSLGYGGHICYLNSASLVGVAFMLPLGLVLVSNVVFFLFTVVAISRIDKIKRQTGRDRRNAHIYIRLSSMTSVMWVFALLAEIPGCEFLRLVSVAVNSSQGIFLFFSYTFNRRVQMLWMSRGRRRGATSALSSTSTKLTSAMSSTSSASTKLTGAIKAC